MQDDKFIIHLKKYAVDYILFFAGSIGVVVSVFFGEKLYNAFVKWATLVFALILILLVIIKIIRMIVKMIIERWTEKLSLSIANQIKQKLDFQQTSSLQNVDYVLNNSILMKEGYPHISMRIETIQKIFDDIVDKVSDPSVLSILGKNVADNFINQTWEQMNNRVMGQGLTPKECIHKWLNMEKTAGWGLFEASLSDINDGKFRGEIKVTNCFLAYKRNSQNNNLCLFLIGYMEVIISHMARFDVTVIERRCGKDAGDSVCYFSFEPK